MREPEVELVKGAWYYNPMMERHGHVCEPPARYTRLLEWEFTTYLELVFDAYVSSDGRMFYQRITQSNSDYEREMEIVVLENLTSQRVREFERRKGIQRSSERLGI